MPDAPFPSRPDLTGRRTLHLPFDLDAGDRGRFGVALTLTLEELGPEEYSGRPAIGIPDFLAWIDGRGADHQLANAEVIQRAQQMAQAGRWREFLAEVSSNGHNPHG